MTDVYSKKKRSEIMSRIKSKGTVPEEKVADILSSLGVKYKRNVNSLTGKPDFVVESANTVIFVNGCFWHGHSNCKRSNRPKTNAEFWKQKINKNISRDRKSARLLRKEGWHVITIWQCRLRNPESVIKRLEKLLSGN